MTRLCEESRQGRDDEAICNFKPDSSNSTFKLCFVTSGRPVNLSRAAKTSIKHFPGILYPGHPISAFSGTVLAGAAFEKINP